MDLGLEGKNAIVTGGSMGIGTAICLDLAKNGADVALTYRKHGDEAKAIAEEIKDRDYRDMNREHSPLEQAEDAVLVDTSYMDIDETVNAIIQLVERS